MLICTQCGNEVDEKNVHPYPVYSEEEHLKFADFIRQCKLDAVQNGVDMEDDGNQLPKPQSFHFRSEVRGSGRRGVIGGHSLATVECGPIREAFQQEVDAKEWEDKIKNLIE